MHHSRLTERGQCLVRALNNDISTTAHAIYKHLNTHEHLLYYMFMYIKQVYVTIT